MQPLLGVELDDASHARKDRAERDDFVDNAFAAAGLPLLRIPAQRAYNTRELAEKTNSYLAVPVTAYPMAPPDPTPLQTPPPTTPSAPPTCPKCGETMCSAPGQRVRMPGRRSTGARTTRGAGRYYQRTHDNLGTWTVSRNRENATNEQAALFPIPTQGCLSPFWQTYSSAMLMQMPPSRGR
jgi:hypothetical protein